jgi:hypothetical protein
VERIYHRYLFSLVTMSLLWSSPALAYKVKWMFGPKHMQKEGANQVTFQQIKGLALSKYFPIKEAVTIVNLDVKTNKAGNEAKCGKNFFPHQGLKLKDVDISNVYGVDVINGTWEAGQRYMIFTCFETPTGYRTSTASIRLPFLKRYSQNTFVTQLEFSNSLISEFKQKKTTFNFKKFIRSLNDLVIGKAHAQGLPWGGGGSGGSGGSSGLIDFSPLTDELAATRQEIARTRVALTQESDEWQIESDEWQNIFEGFNSDIVEQSEGWGVRVDELSDEVFGKVDDISKMMQEESDQWQELGEGVLGQWKSTEDFLRETINEKKLFSLAFSTAAGAAIGSFGVNALLNGITTGVGALIQYIAESYDRKVDNYEDILKLSNEIKGSFNDLEDTLDAMVLKLPQIYAVAGSDIYSSLEVHMEKFIDAKIRAYNLLQDKVEEEQKKLDLLAADASWSGDHDQADRFSQCSSKLALDQRLLFEEQKIKDMIDALKLLSGHENLELALNPNTADVNDYYLKKSDKKKKGLNALDLKAMCSKIYDLLDAWRAAEAKVAGVEALLSHHRGIKSKMVQKHFKKMRKALNASRLKKDSKKDVLKSFKRASKVRNKALKDMSKKYKKLFKGGQFQQDFSSCEVNWCHASYEYPEEDFVSAYGTDQSCNAVIHDEKQRGLAATEIKKLQDLYETRKKRCFNRKFRKNYPDAVKNEIGCNNAGSFGNYKELAACSEDFQALDAIYGEIRAKAQQLTRKDGLIDNIESGTTSLKYAAAYEALAEMDGHLAAVTEGVEDHLQDVRRKYKHQNLIDQFCGPKQVQQVANDDVVNNVPYTPASGSK